MTLSGSVGLVVSGVEVCPGPSLDDLLMSIAQFALLLDDSRLSLLLNAGAAEESLIAGAVLVAVPAVVVTEDEPCDIAAVATDCCSLSCLWS